MLLPAYFNSKEKYTKRRFKQLGRSGDAGRRV